MHRRPALLIGAATVAPVAWLQRNFAGPPDDKRLTPGSSVIVVGAGVVGVATAHELSRRGYRVRVLEQGEAVCGPQSASWGNAGTLGRTNRTVPLSSTPFKIVEALLRSSRAPTPQSGTGVYFNWLTLRDPYFWLWGLTYLRASLSSAITDHLADHWKELNAASQRATFEVAELEGLTVEADMRIDGRTAIRSVSDGPALSSPSTTLSKREPRVSCNAAEVSVTAGDGQGSCEAFTVGLARACAEKYSARFEVGVDVSELLLDAHGRCTGVRVRRKGDAGGATEQMHAEAVVLCAGASVAPLAATAGLYVPVQPLRGYSITARVPHSAKPSIVAHMTFAPSHLYATRLGDTVRFTCFGEMYPVQRDGPGVPTTALAAALRELVELEVSNVAELCDWSDAVEWHGSRPLSPDCQPLTGATRVPGLFINVGHSFNGWREAVLSARCLGERLGGRSSNDEAAAVLACAARAYSPQRYQPYAVFS